MALGLGVIFHKWAGSRINLPTGVFSVWEPERSSINLTAVDYIRVADVASGPRNPSFYGVVRQPQQGIRHQATEMAAGRVGKESQRCEKPGGCRKVLLPGRPLTMSTAADMATMYSVYHRDLLY